MLYFSMFKGNLKKFFFEVVKLIKMVLQYKYKIKKEEEDMEKVNYANMAKDLLGDELYIKLINEVAKENKNENLADFGKIVIEKMCLLIVMLGMSKKVKLDTVKICAGKEIINVSCKQLEKKYQEYIEQIEKNISSTLEKSK